MGTQGLGEVGTRGREIRDVASSRSWTRDQGRGEVRNKRNHFLLRMNVKYNFQRIKGCSLYEGLSEHRQTTLSLFLK